jgi:uncharacterized protein YqkB
MAKSKEYFSITYPGKDRIKFDGGLNNKYDNTVILDNEACDCRNVVFGPGFAATRPGCSQIGSNVTAKAGQGLTVRHAVTGTAETMVAFFGGEPYYLSGTSWVGFNTTTANATFVASMDSNARIAYTEYWGNLYFSDGSNQTLRYNPNGNIMQHTLSTPVGLDNGISTGVAAGSLSTGTYMWNIAGVNSNGVIGLLHPSATTKAMAANASAQFYTPLFSQGKVSGVNCGWNEVAIYRTTAGGDTFYLHSIRGFNSAIVDTTPDTDLVDEYDPDVEGPPPYTAAIIHQNRMFVVSAADPIVCFSEVGNADTFKVESYMNFGDKTKDRPRTLASIGASLYVGCDNTSWIVAMPDGDPSNWQILKVKVPFGTLSPHCHFVFNDKVFFAAIQNKKFVGFGYITGDSSDPQASVTENQAIFSDLVTDKIEPDMFAITQTGSANKITAIAFKNRAYISTTYGGSPTYNSRIYYFDFRPDSINQYQPYAWCPWTGLNAADFTEYEGNLYYQSSDTTGTVHQMLVEGQYNDNENAIDSFYKTKQFGGFEADQLWTKDFRWLNLLMESTGPYQLVGYTILESELGDGTGQEIDLSQDGSLFGTAVFGVDVFTAGNRVKEYKIPLGAFVGKLIQFKFTNSAVTNACFKLVGMTITYNLRGKR